MMKWEYNTYMRSAFLLLIIFISFGVIYSSEYTDALLDKAIEEFSKENYKEALSIVDEVLIEEPENTTAQMYKKTIEDVSTIDKIENLSSNVKDNIKTENDVVQKPEESTNGNDNKHLPEILNFYSYIGSTSDGEFIAEQKAKIYLGLPVFDISIKTNTIDYDINTIFSETFPIEKINVIDSNSIDVSMGVRFIPDNILGTDPGFVDFRIGASSFLNYSDIEKNKVTLPFIGYDVELHLLKFLGSNLIFDNIWFGSRGSIYLYNSEIVNNSQIEFKGGFRVGHFNFGSFFNTTDIESIDFRKVNYGIILGIVL